MNLRPGLAAVMCVIGIGGFAAPAAAASHPVAQHKTKAHNANFKGTWAASTGGWVITKENKKSGSCKGTSDYPGYLLRQCQVTGHKYKFTIVYGAYKSYNKGTFHKHSAKGSFHDTNGTKEHYTASRS